MAENNDAGDGRPDVDHAPHIKYDPPAPVDPGPGGALQQWGMGPSHIRFWSSWSIADMPGKALLSKCMGGADRPGASVIGETLKLWGAMIHPVDLVDKVTGEVRQQLRCVLVLEDMSTVGFVSAGVIKGVQLCCMICGAPPWEPAIAVKVRQVQTQNGNRTYVLELDANGMKRPGKRGGK